MELRTTRLRLRHWTGADLEPFALLNADATVMEHFPAALSRQESDALANRIQAHLDRHGWGLWALEIPGVAKFAGFVGLATPRFESHFTPCTEVGWRLAAEFWGRGYASEAAAAAVRFGFESLSLAEVVSFSVPANRRSIRVMERIGMTSKPDDDFDHPGFAEGHPLRRHVLFRIARPR